MFALFITLSEAGAHPLELRGETLFLLDTYYVNSASFEVQSFVKVQFQQPILVSYPIIPFKIK